ncbi:MAG: hypothetical protein R2729_16880 [Bryobacteraceae bacterium]
MSIDLDFWPQCEGISVDGLFPLDRFVGQGSRGSVFETQFQGRPAVIKLVPGANASSAALRDTWTKARELEHPALIRIFASGEAEVNGQQCAFCVMEKAEENLADVLSERALTEDEVGELLPPLLDALRYLHGRGFAHGALKSANIMATGDQLKLALDNLAADGDQAADCRSVGVLLQQLLNHGAIDSPREPYDEIIRNCLNPDVSERWTIEQIQARVRGEAPPVAGKLRWVLAAAALAALAFVVVPYFRSPPPDPPAARVEAPPPAASAPEPAREDPPKPSPLSPPKRQNAAEDRAPRLAPTQLKDGVTAVMPSIPGRALGTIRGTVRVNVRVRVDSGGRVTSAEALPPGASRYFTDRVLAAARQWKLPPGAGEANLRFELTRDGVNGFVVR